MTRRDKVEVDCQDSCRWSPIFEAQLIMRDKARIEPVSVISRSMVGERSGGGGDEGDEGGRRSMSLCCSWRSQPARTRGCKD